MEMYNEVKTKYDDKMEIDMFHCCLSAAHINERLLISWTEVQNSQEHVQWWDCVSNLQQQI